ncbi:beta-lactamase family protein [bacterium]|nr:beta-lactamase family protein [bacterium]
MMTKVSLSVLILLISFNTFADSMDDYIESQMKEQRIPGISLAILKNGKILKLQGYGFSNLEHQVAAKPETIYQSGSVGKQFTAAAVMLLVEDGKINLDDPVSKYFERTPKSWKKITVRHLLTHTSGIRDYTQKDLDYWRDYTEDDLLQLLMKLPLEFSPGEKWNYSNSGYMLLGFLIHKACGKFYGDLLEERIFGLLGMTTAQVISESDIIANRAAGYELKNGKLENQRWVSPSLNTTADGALYLTALDMALWAEALNGEQLLKRESLTQMWTSVKLKNGTSYPYGFGWRIGFQRGHRVIEHSGHWQGFSTAICRYPDFGLTVIVLANLADIASLSFAEEVAGVQEPELRPVTFLKTPASSGDPGFAEPIKQMLADIAQDKRPEILMPAFQTTIGKETRDEVGKIMKEIKTFDFLGCDEVKGEPIELFGGQAIQFCYYRLVTVNETRILTAGVTSHGKITEFSLLE